MIINSILNFLSIIATFVSLKLVFYFLSNEELDKFFFIQGISLSISSVLSVSFELLFQYLIPKSNENENKEILFLSLMFSITFYLLGSFFFYLFYEKYKNILLMLLFLLPYAIFPIFTLFLYSAKKFYISNFFQIISSTMTLFLVFFIKPRKCETLIILYFTNYVLLCLILMIFTKPTYNFSKNLISKIINYFKLTFISGISAPVYRYADRFILERYGESGELAGFSVVRKIDLIIRQIVNAPLSMAIVHISSDNSYEKKFIKNYIIMIIVAFTCEILIGIAVLNFILLGSAKKFYFSMILFSISFLLSGYFTFRISVSRVRGNLKPFTVYNLFFLIAYPTISLIFMKFRFNAIAFSFFLSTLIGGLLALIFERFKISKI